MNLPDAPIAHEGFFVTYFFTVRDQENRRAFTSEFLAGRWPQASWRASSQLCRDPRRRAESHGAPSRTAHRISAAKRREGPDDLWSISRWR